MNTCLCILRVVLFLEFILRVVLFLEFSVESLLLKLELVLKAEVFITAPLHGRKWPQGIVLILLDFAPFMLMLFS